MELFERLRQRKLVQWALAYVAFAFALLQGVDIIAQQFAWSDGVRRGITIALAIGFFVALVLAWYHGERGAQRVSGAELLILALLLAIGGAVLWWMPKSLRDGARGAAGPAASAPAVAQGRIDAVPPAVPANDKSIAVLPFANLSDDKANAYFADGMQDEILTKLAKIGALRVISRTSTRPIASAPENLGEIARQLGVANVIEGSVQKAGNAVHINVQLIRAASDEHLWAESYDRTLDNIFGVEGEVAQKVAEALEATLIGAERQAVAAKGTHNARAFEAYLRGRAADNSQYTNAGTMRAIDYYLEAVHEDPQFAQAWAAVAVAMSNMYLNDVDSARSTPDAVRHAAETAVRLQPQLAESLLARGAYLYRVERDFPAALDSYRQALALQPGDVDIMSEMFFVERRMGRWDAAIAHYREAIARDPRNVSIRVQGACEIFLRLRRFDETRELLQQALTIAPDDTAASACLAEIDMQLGRLDAAAQWLARIPEERREPYEYEARVGLLTLRRDEPALTRFMQASLLRDDAQLDADDITGLICLAVVQRANAHADRARATFERLARVLAAVPGGVDHVAEVGSISALVYAGLGDWNRAFAAARHQIEVQRNDANEIAVAKITLAQIQAQHGERDQALAVLPELLQMPSGVTPALLALDPNWDAIRADPRFVALTRQPVGEYPGASP